MDISTISNRTDAIHAPNAVIQEITHDRGTTYVLITYAECPSCRRETTVNLVVGRDTIIMDEAGNRIPARSLQVGMNIHASFSSAMTRSIPPQAAAFHIRILQRPENENTSIGRVIEVNQRQNYLLTMSNLNPSSIIRFNLTPDTSIFDSSGRRLCCLMLLSGLRVRIQHAPFMTASIPPQTTAFSIQVLGR